MSDPKFRRRFEKGDPFNFYDTPNDCTRLMPNAVAYVTRMKPKERCHWKIVNKINHNSKNKNRRNDFSFGADAIMAADQIFKRSAAQPPCKKMGLGHRFCILPFLMHYFLPNLLTYFYFQILRIFVSQLPNFPTLYLYMIHIVPFINITDTVNSRYCKLWYWFDRNLKEGNKLHQ